ncbi:DoxX family protein [Microlunatus soli]|uniref:DoxX-like family protein n=1 Tax=Microlunatus soli TaxID=630515 RepID=A0A1H1PKP4_9ACTN|nr:DoxX family protein [Microlunatus soli]SDS11726.1 DoxX-like family protein [Microlunatus soli]
MTTLTDPVQISAVPTAEQPRPQRRSLTIAGWILTAFGGAFLVFDGVNHVLLSQSVQAGANNLGMDPQLFLPIGIIQLIFVGLYLVPRTSTFGAILLTAFLGGAVCSNVIAGQPFFGYVMSGVYTAVIIWFGVWLRTPALRRLVPFRR